MPIPLTEIWCMARHSEDGGFKVSLVTRQINEGYDFGRLFANSDPVKITVVWLVHNLKYFLCVFNKQTY